MKINKKLIIIYLLCLFPIVYGSLLYNDLPELIRSVDGNPYTHYLSKFIVIYLSPIAVLIMAILTHKFFKIIQPQKDTTNLLIIFPILSNFYAGIAILLEYIYF